MLQTSGEWLKVAVLKSYPYQEDLWCRRRKSWRITVSCTRWQLLMKDNHQSTACRKVLGVYITLLWGKKHSMLADKCRSKHHHVLMLTTARIWIFCLLFAEPEWYWKGKIWRSSGRSKAVKCDFKYWQSHTRNHRGYVAKSPEQIANCLLAEETLSKNSRLFWTHHLWHYYCKTAPKKLIYH